MFLTLNPAEYDWPEVLEMYKEIHKNEKCTINEFISMDPVLFAKYFQNRVRSTFRYLRSKDGPFNGLLKHYFYRIEYQERGTAHVHCLLWIRDAPIIGKDDSNLIVNFINEMITCRMPDQDNEPLLHSWINKYQLHKHSSKYFLLFIRVFRNMPTYVKSWT